MSTKRPQNGYRFSLREMDDKWLEDALEAIEETRKQYAKESSKVKCGLCMYFNKPSSSCPKCPWQIFYGNVCGHTRFMYEVALTIKGKHNASPELKEKVFKRLWNWKMQIKREQKRRISDALYV